MPFPPHKGHQPPPHKGKGHQPPPHKGGSKGSAPTSGVHTGDPKAKPPAKSARQMDPILGLKNAIKAAQVDQLSQQAAQLFGG